MLLKTSSRKLDGKPLAYLLCLCMVLVSWFAGCARSRMHHRTRADQDSQGAIVEKSFGLPWQPREQYSAYSHPLSRWQVPGTNDCPQLPDPAPKLYSYDIPIALEEAFENTTSNADSGDNDPVVSPIPPVAWFDIPIECRQRMFDFVRLRQEAERTSREFDAQIQTDLDSETPKLNLREIVDLALLNSRDYLTQKETLYQVALQLSFERFQYQLNPTPNGNGIGTNFNHNRFGGTTVDNLAVGSNYAMQRVLCTGGDFLASFANNVLLTFNGPSGFAADVSSDLLFELTQPILQRDIRFESLTRAERNLVYAVRGFARFRKVFFTQFASQYYGLIRSYRQIEIESQNYFSLVRAFNQAEAEYRAGLVPRFQVDQVEQNLLNGRGSLIGTCNSVEQSLDSLKLAIGIPVETLINIDLSELDELTLSDQLAVDANLISRVQNRLTNALREPVRIELLSTGVVLIDRLLAATKLREQLGMEALNVSELSEIRGRLLVDSARESVGEVEVSLKEELESPSPSLPVIFQRTLALSKAQQELFDRQYQLAEILSLVMDEMESLKGEQQAGMETSEKLADRLQEMIRDEQLQDLPVLVRDTRELQLKMQDLVSNADRVLQLSSEEMSDEARTKDTVAKIQSLLERSGNLLENIESTLAPVKIGVDDAMVTALLLRFDLMNQRGALADDLRQIKLAADDLKSILNLSASQTISTDSSSNNPVNFDFDDSQTSLRVTFDAPLNRQAQRNAFRNSLINYQRGIRDLGGLEDNIKFSVRNDLRSLELDQEQYNIAVASAALAFERVVSTSLEFRLGTGGVSARDFLEAQTAYTDALSSVASRHIDYIVDRTQLFLDLELLVVDENGFWKQLYDEDYQPERYFEFPSWAFPIYGDLPCVNYSRSVRDPLNVPVGPAQVLKRADSQVDAELMQTEQVNEDSMPKMGQNE